MSMKILKVTDNGSGFGPRGKACMEVAIEVPVQTTQHMRLMHQMYSVTKKWDAVNDAMGGFAAVSYDGNLPILWVRYAPRYQAEDDVLDMDIVSSQSLRDSFKNGTERTPDSTFDIDITMS